MSDEMNPKEGKVLTFVNKGVNIQLARIARGSWDVLAVLDDRGGCPALDFIAALGANYTAAKRGLLRVLRVELPQDGPPARNTQRCKSLGGGIFEIRRQPKGQKLRVLFFYDDGRRIVCTNAFAKAERTPRNEVELARAAKQRYLKAKFRRKLEIVEEAHDGYG
jgi:phage-related protein